jgi:hypothetical protein
MKEVESVLGKEARKWASSGDPAQRGLGDAIRELQSSLRGAVERSAGPESAAELKAANTAWANFVRIADASGRAGAVEGRFTAPQLDAAVRKAGSKSAYRKGDALMQDLSDAGKGVLPSSVPDSGTASRIFTGGGVGALLGNMAGIEPTTMALGGAALLPYTNMGGQAMLKLLAERPEFAGVLAEILRRGAPAGGVASGLMAPSLTGP